MSVYYLLFILMAGLVFARLADYIDDRFVFIVAGVVLFFTAALRADYIDKDYGNYINSFHVVQRPADYFLHYTDWRFFEPFHYLVPAVMKQVFSWQAIPYIFFGVFAFLGLRLKFAGIRLLSSFPALSIFVYFPFYFLIHEMTQIRAGVSTGLFLLAIHAHYHRNYGRFIGIWLLAVMFQYTSVLIPLILLFNPRKFSLKLLMGIMLGALVAGVLAAETVLGTLLQFNVAFLEKLAAQLQTYDETTNRINFFNAEFIPVLLITFWLLIKHKEVTVHNKYAPLLLKIQVLSLVAFVVLSPIALVAYRIYEFFGVVSIINIPLVIYTFNSRMVGYSIACCYALVMLVINLHVAELVSPYNFIFIGRF